MGKIPKSEIEALYASGLTLQKIGDKYGLSKQRIHQILDGYNSNFGYYFKKKLRKEIGYCQECGKKRASLHVHHVDKNHQNNSPENLLVVCVPCHKTIHAHESRKRWNGPVAKRTAVNCPNCKKDFISRGCRIKKFCSKKCYVEYSNPVIKCAFCHKLFRKRRCQLGRYLAPPTCSRSCRSKYRWSKQ